MKINNTKNTILGLFGILVSLSSQACEIGNGQYELLGNKNFSANFERQKTGDNSSELLLNLISKETKQSYWFRFNAGNGYSSLSLTPIEQPKEKQGAVVDLNKPQSLHQPIYFIKKDLSFYSSELNNNTKAPQYFLATNLGEALWYGASNLGAADGIKENMLRGFFKLKSCS